MSVLVTLTACSPATVTAPGSTTPTPSSVSPPGETQGHANITGDLLLMLGPTPGRASLYRYDPAAGKFEQLTPPNFLIDYVTRAGASIVVSGVGGFGGATLFTLGPKQTITPLDLPLPADASADSPAGRADGLIAYAYSVPHVIVPHKVVSYTGELRAHDLTSGTDRVLADSPFDLGNEAWGPDDALVFEESDDSHHVYSVEIRDSSGGRRRISTAPGGVALLWDTAGQRPIVMGEVNASPVRTVVLDPATGGHVASLTGWRPLSWYGPSGNRLLVASGNVIGLWDFTHSKPASVGSVTNGGLVWGGTWYAG